MRDGPALRNAELQCALTGSRWNSANPVSRPSSAKYERWSAPAATTLCGLGCAPQSQPHSVVRSWRLYVHCSSYIIRDTGCACLECAPVFAQEEPTAWVEHLAEGLTEPLAAQPVAGAILALELYVDAVWLRDDLPPSSLPQ